MRGCYQSSRPAPDRRGIGDHGQDALAALDALGWDDEPVIIGGWSLGVQIALELWRVAPQRIAGLLLICGTYERPLLSALPIPGSHLMLPAVVKRLARSGPLVDRGARAVMRHPLTAKAAQALNIIAGGDPAYVARVLKAFSALDVSMIASIVAQAADHSAADVLPTTAVPTLILAGDRDVLTPLDRSAEMHSRIPHSKMKVYSGGTHYTVLEQLSTVLADVALFVGAQVANNADMTAQSVGYRDCD